MGGKIWKWKMVSGLAAVAILGVIALPAFAQRNKTIQVRSELVTACPFGSVDGVTYPGCATDVGLLRTDGKPHVYSLLPDDFYTGDYSSNELNVQSEILTHNTVYTLDTLDTLVGGLVVPGTRYVKMHFYFPDGIQKLDPKYGLLPRIPDCWVNSTVNTSDQNEAVNWSVFTSNSVAFTDLQKNQSVGGFSRLDFNVRDTISSCYTQVFRFWLRWPKVTITLLDDTPGKRVWQATTNEYGEASLEGQGGKRGQTQYYGDFRVPFKLTLTEK
ncbi:MAG: hypothetical protein A3H28_09270 [Acidobacteria bacterium RIFCSPLOWO2_02_FULL_61_28]|nr:MAG: hypothetical protein A3H28_09270 [Acidobacteria bacterium RIFCSPLOWO2_02_FULL_61_28]